MNWHHDADALLLGEEAGAVWDAVEMADISGMWRNGYVLRVEMGAGWCAWVWRAASGKPTVLAVAPLGESWDADMVEGAAFFGRPVPPNWLTKARAAHTKAGFGDGRQGRAKKGYDKGWCVGLLADKHTVALCKVVDFNGDTLLRVLVDDDAPTLRLDQHEAVKWWPAGQWARGLAELWRQGVRSCHNWKLLCMRAALAEKRLDKEAARLEAKGKAGVGSVVVGVKPEAGAKPRKPWRGKQSQQSQR